HSGLHESTEFFFGPMHVAFHRAERKLENLADLFELEVAIDQKQEDVLFRLTQGADGAAEKRLFLAVFAIRLLVSRAPGVFDRISIEVFAHVLAALFELHEPRDAERVHPKRTAGLVETSILSVLNKANEDLLNRVRGLGPG